MRKEKFSTVFTGQTSNEADAISRELRTIGLHPAELGLTAPISIGGLKATFPVEVPCGESDKAMAFLSRNHPTTNRGRL